MDNNTDESKESGTAELEVAREFPELFAFLLEHPDSLPHSVEAWERHLRVSRNCQPILADLRARGLNLVRLDQYTPPGFNRRPLYEAVLKWLPKVQDPLSLTICLSRLTEPSARNLIKKNRQLLLRLTHELNARLHEDDCEHTLYVLSQCVMKAILERDLPEVLDWARDTRLSAGVRASYVLNLERFARKPGLARDSLLAFVKDGHVGSAAVRALAGALKADALPLLHEFRESSPHNSVRDTAADFARKIESRLGRVDFVDSKPSTLPDGYISRSIEFDTDRVPQFLSILERELNADLKPGIREQLALAANQIKRGRKRFYVVPITLSNGVLKQLGLGLYAEDDDVIIVAIHFDQKFRDAVDAALACFIDGS